jgi:hypothetical protein
MAYTKEALAELGLRHPTQRMLEQSGVSVAAAKQHAADLEKWFPAARTAELEGLQAQIAALYDEQAEKKLGAATGNVRVAEVFQQAKDWVSDLIAAADSAFEEEPDLADEYHKGGKVGRSVPKLLGRMGALLAQAEKHQAELAEWGFNAQDLERGRQLVKALGDANTVQEGAVKDLPPKTRELNVVKGRAYLLLKRLARAGRRAFARDPATARKFALDVLNRRGRRSGGASEPPQQPPPA